MSDLISSGESASETKEAPADVKGMLQMAQWVFLGVLSILGVSLVGVLFGEKLKPKDTKESKSEKEDEDTVADYDKEYLDGDISEDALDEKTVGLSA